MAVWLFQGINVVSIAVPDLDRGREFYRDVLGFGPPLYDLPEAGWIEFRMGAEHGDNARAEHAGLPPRLRSTSRPRQTAACRAMTR